MMLEGAFLWWWISSFIIGLYLILIHNDYWIGIPLTIFGSMILWGFIYEGCKYVITGKINSELTSEGDSK